MGMISNIFIKALTSGEMFLDWNVKKKTNKKKTGPGIVVQLEP